MAPESTQQETRIVRILFVLVVLTFLGAERASGPLKRGLGLNGAATAGRADTGAAATPVAFR